MDEWPTLVLIAAVTYFGALGILKAYVWALETYRKRKNPQGF